MAGVSAVGVALVWGLGLLQSVRGDETYGYPEYDEQDEFTAAQTDALRAAQDVSEWGRMKPWLTTVKAHMDDYVWLEYREPCPSMEGQAAEEAGCQYSMLSDPAWQTHATAMEWDLITPETHPANYVLAVAYYAVWLIVQAILSLFGAVLSCCCLRKKKMEEQPAPPVMWVARGILGLLLLATIVMANSMEVLGNRGLNDSMHNAIHSVEGLFNYADDWIGLGGVGHDLLDVGDDVYNQVDVVKSRIFDHADPVALHEAATCMQDIGASCAAPEYDELMSQFFDWAGDGDGPEGSPPSTGKCDISAYTVDEDYVLASSLGPNVILDALPAQGHCAIVCLVGQSGCTGAQWTMQDDGNGGQIEEDCVLWLHNQCQYDSTTGSANGYTAGVAENSATQPTHVVYKRVPSSVPAGQTECVQTKTVDTVNAIYDNVLALPAEIMDIINVMHTMMQNQVTICLLDGLATPLGDALESLVSPIEDLQGALDGILAQIRDGIESGRDSLDKADDAYATLKSPPANGEWGVSIQESGEPYPMRTVTDPAKPAECSGGLSCALTLDQTACQPSDSDTDICTYSPAHPVLPYEERPSCQKLACYDNSLNYYDENRGGDLPIARTQLFTIFSMAATFGSVLGLIALATNRLLLWKLMCFLFFLWGPASLILSGVAHPPMIFASDACQDIEEVLIDVTLASRPEWNPTAGTITLMEGAKVMETLNSLPNFNYTGDPIEDITTDNMPDLMRYYLTDDCQGPAGAGIAATLDALEQVLIDVVRAMATNAGELVETMADGMGDSGMELREGVKDEIRRVTIIVRDDVPPIVSRAFGLLGCPRLSQAYYELKSPICCDVVVSMYWVACAFPALFRLLTALVYPLSVMGICTLTTMILTIFLGAKAFPGETEATEATDEKSVENPVFDK